MLERYLKLKDVVQEILLEIDNTEQMISFVEEVEIKEILTILQPFEVATKIFSAEKYLTASKIILVINIIRNKLLNIKCSGNIT